MRSNTVMLVLLLTVSAAAAVAQAPRVWSPQELFTRNIGTREQQDKAFPPHKMIGNIHYVGTETLASFLITTPQGHILINSMYERNVPTIKKSVEDLGFKFADIKIILGSHAHADHMEADEMMKEMTGAQVMAMDADLPALRAMKPGGKEHPIDRVLHDGETVTLGGTTLMARWTPGHTKGCTTWTMSVQEGGKSYDVAIIGSMGVNPGTRLVNNPTNPTIADEYTQGFKVMHALHVDVPLGSHPGMYNMAEKYAKLQTSGVNPYIDPQGYAAEIALVELTFTSTLAEQRKAVQ
jgi:metallo-beta-lactamase class B